MTFRDVGRTTRICVRGVGLGQLWGELLVDGFTSPPHITFGSETRFHSHHNNYYVPYDLEFSYQACKIIPGERQPWTVESNEREFEVDSSREWVVSSGERICWIPPGYIKSDEDGCCWAGSDNLVMVGEDGRLRKLTFRSQKRRS